MVEITTVLVTCFASFIAGFAIGGLFLFLGAWLGSRYSSPDTGRFFPKDTQEEFIPHEVSEDYFDRALSNPGDGGLEFPADFSDEALDELAKKMDDGEISSPEELRAKQLRGYQT